MKPSSLATVILRLAALFITLYGIFTAGCAVWLYFKLRSLMEDNNVGQMFEGQNPMNGKISGIDFQASSLGSIFWIQIACVLAVIAIGIILWKLSRGLGLWIGKDLQ